MDRGDAAHTMTALAARGATTAWTRPWWDVLGDVALITLFLVVDGQRTWDYTHLGMVSFGGDATIYRAAAEAWLSGGDPWAVAVNGVFFGAPPPTLLWAALFVPLSTLVTRALWIGIAAGASVWAVRRLGLPIWWVLFPPLWISIITGNPNALVLALLLAGLGPLASVAKIYAVVPLVLLGRWREVAWTIALLAVTAPFLPWGLYIASAGRIETIFVDQTAALSAWGTALLIPTAIVVLLLGRRGAWLAVPALWPYTQIHYAALALPACSRWVAACMAVQIQLAPVIGVMVAGVEQVLQRSQAARSSPTIDESKSR